MIPGGGSTAHATSTRSSGVVIGSVRGFEHRGAFVGRHVDALHREFPSRDDGPDHVSAGRAAAASVLLLYRLGPLGPGHLSAARDRQTSHRRLHGFRRLHQRDRERVPAESWLHHDDDRLPRPQPGHDRDQRRPAIPYHRRRGLHEHGDRRWRLACGRRHGHVQARDG